MSLAQQPGDADIPAMPHNATRHDDVDASLPLHALPSTLHALALGESVVGGV
jgi:hypothetical protein